MSEKRESTLDKPKSATRLRGIRAALSKLADPILARVMVHRGIIVNPYITGKYLPLQESAPYFILQQTERTPDRDELPVPPQDLWEGWGPTAEDYLSSGQKDLESMLRILENAGENPVSFRAVLDLGCAAGRMLRFFPFAGKESERWGVDIKAKQISWCQLNLSPPFRFATTTTMPHLPFEDNYFDLVYCGSVFTHMSELADAWLLELLRILRRGGYAYITVHDKNTLKILMGEYRHRTDHASLVNALLRLHEQAAVLNNEFNYFSIHTEPHTQVFYDLDYLVRRWSNFARIVSVNLKAMDYQTALLLQKPCTRHP
jgi:SAM-dependent methyltransferase